MARVDAKVLDKLAPLLDELRTIPGMEEIKPGIFYVKRNPMLHFHGAGDEVVADLKSVVAGVPGFDRFEAVSETGKRKLVAEATRRCLVLLEKKSR